MSQKNGKIIICQMCGIEKYKSKSALQSNNLFCSSQCHWEWRQKEYISKWKSGEIDGFKKGWRNNKQTSTPSDYIRTYLFKINNNSCSQCGWDKINKNSGKCPLEIDHIDGNHLNGRPENLRLLCPNCHSLTNTYKGNNKK